MTATEPAGPPAGMTRRSVMKALTMAGGVVSVPGLLAACAGSSGTSGGRKTLRSLTVALPNSVSTLNLMHEAGIVNYVIALLCQESLVGVSPAGALTPQLAASWKQPDARTFVYEIRKGVAFSDGTPLSTADVVASISANASKGSTSDLAYAYAGMKSVAATGPSEVTLTLDAPNAMFGWTPSPGTLQISSAAFLKKHGSALGTPGVGILGTGPYRLAEFVPGSHVTLVRNEHWWGGRVPIAKVRLQFITDDTTRQYAMRSGSVQMALNVPLDQVSQWKQISGVSVDVATDNSLVTLAFNTAKKPWDDIHVRRAVAHAVNRPGIVHSIMHGYGEVAQTFPTKSEWGGMLTPAQVGQLYARIPQYNFSISQARAELAASSVPHGFSDTVTYPNSGPQIGQALLTLSQNLQQLGIHLAVKEVTLEQWIAGLNAHKSGIYAGWYFPVTGDPAEYAQQLLNGDYAGVNGTNIAGYRNPAVTAALNASQSSTNPAERARLISQALVTAAADVPYQPLWWGQAATAFGPGLSPVDYGPYYYVGPWATRLRAS